jgi:hypothetical protein
MGGTKTTDSGVTYRAKKTPVGGSGGGSGGSGGGSRNSGPDYRLRPNESINDYHSRVGRERGDSPEYVRDMQRGAEQTFRNLGMDMSRLTKGLTTSPITPAEIGEPVVPVTMPEKVTYDPGNVTAGTMTSLAPGLAEAGITVDPKTGMMTFSGIDANAEGRQTDLNNLFDEKVSAESVFNKTQRQTGELEWKREMNKYAGIINGINSQAQADTLALEGQGRGIPEVIIGGQQAQINKEAAIKVLQYAPLLAMAQDNYELAAQQTTQLFQIRMADINTEFQFKTNVINAFWDTEDKKEQRVFEVIQARNAEMAQQARDNAQQQNSWAQMAIETNQPGLVKKILALDPKSATFRTDFAALTGQIVKPPTVDANSKLQSVVIDGVGYSFDPVTGTYTKQTDAIGAGGLGSSTALDTITRTKEYANDALGLKDAAGRSGIRRAVEAAVVGATDFTKLQSLVDSIKVNLLTLNTDPGVKKFFGPQMSNRDTELMTSAATPLDVSKMDPTMAATYINDALDMLDRMEAAMPQETTWGAGGFLAPDGSNNIIIFTDPVSTSSSI